jgi:hypothetical protein
VEERDPKDTKDQQRDGADAGGEDKGVRDDAGKETVEKTVEDGDATREARD